MTNTYATEKQVSFIQKLAAERGTEAQKAQAAQAAGFFRSAASQFIDELLSQKPAFVAGGKFNRVTEAGMYLMDGRIFKVQVAVHGSGNLYAKELVDGEFIYAQGAMRNLRAEDRMTLEQAKQYGALYGTCVVCGRTLTNEVSIAEGIGPVCAGRL